MRHRIPVAVVCALALCLAVAGCVTPTGTTDRGPGDPQEQQAVVVDSTGTAPSPAPDVSGARRGGTLEVLEDGPPEHLDPQQVYSSDAQEISTLVFRALTGYIEGSNGKPSTLVGDLATNTGVSSHGDKTWTYQLRDGIKFSDGTPITSKDIAYGVARSFGSHGKWGPQYIQNALQANRSFTGDADLPPGVTTPDDKTIVFNLESPHPEFPYLAALPTTVPVPKGRDDGDRYDADFVESGPYMKDGPYDLQTRLKLKRNPNWDPKTDPIRHQYPDAWLFDFTVDRHTQTERLTADRGPDAYGLQAQQVAQAQLGEVAQDADLSTRVISGPTSYVEFIDINTSRVVDLKVRQALNYAFDRGALVSAEGGWPLESPATTIMAPVVPGYKSYDAYPGAGGGGDVDKARKLLGGQAPKLTYCFADTTTQRQYALLVQKALQRAGFQIVLNPVAEDAYYRTIGAKGVACDLMRFAWAEDFPDGDNTLDVLFNGDGIVDGSNQNYSYLNDPDVNKKLDDLKTQSDRANAALAYRQLDQEIMTNYAPVIPWGYVRYFGLHGSKVRGAFLSPLYGLPDLVGAYAAA